MPLMRLFYGYTVLAAAAAAAAAAPLTSEKHMPMIPFSHHTQPALLLQEALSTSSEHTGEGGSGPDAAAAAACWTCACAWAMAVSREAAAAVLGVVAEFKLAGVVEAGFEHLKMAGSQAALA
jgi:hypothetical protein